MACIMGIYYGIVIMAKLQCSAFTLQKNYGRIGEKLKIRLEEVNVVKNRSHLSVRMTTARYIHCYCCERGFTCRTGSHEKQ